MNASEYPSSFVCKRAISPWWLSGLSKRDRVPEINAWILPALKVASHMVKETAGEDGGTRLEVGKQFGQRGKVACCCTDYLILSDVMPAHPPRVKFHRQVPISSVCTYLNSCTVFSNALGTRGMKFQSTSFQFQGVY